MDNLWLLLHVLWEENPKMELHSKILIRENICEGGREQCWISWRKLSNHISADLTHCRRDRWKEAWLGRPSNCNTVKSVWPGQWGVLKPKSPASSGLPRLTEMDLQWCPFSAQSLAGMNQSLWMQCWIQKGSCWALSQLCSHTAELTSTCPWLPQTLCPSSFFVLCQWQDVTLLLAFCLTQLSGESRQFHAFQTLLILPSNMEAHGTLSDVGQLCLLTAIWRIHQWQSITICFKKEG